MRWGFILPSVQIAQLPNPGEAEGCVTSGSTQQGARSQARPVDRSLPALSCLSCLLGSDATSLTLHIKGLAHALYMDRAVGPAEVSLYQGSPLTGQLKVCPFLSFLTFPFEVPAPQPGSVRPALRNPHNIVGEGRAIGGVGSHAVQVSPSRATSGLIMRRGAVCLKLIREAGEASVIPAPISALGVPPGP